MKSKIELFGPKVKILLYFNPHGAMNREPYTSLKITFKCTRGFFLETYISVTQTVS